MGKESKKNESDILINRFGQGFSDIRIKQMHPSDLISEQPCVTADTKSVEREGSWLPGLVYCDKI